MSTPKRTVAEWESELALDGERRVLFVEGARDVEFWRRVVPPSSRRRSVVYPAEIIEAPVGENGVRGKLLNAAGEARSDGIRFFLDADHDRLLGRELPDSVRLSDGRDLEAYSLNDDSYANALGAIRPGSTVPPREYRHCIERVCVPMGLLRLISEREGMKLPFQATLGGRLGRYLSVRGPQCQVDLERLGGALLQNAELSLNELPNLLQQVATEEEKRRDLGAGHLIHGKDACAVLGYVLGMDATQAAALLHLSVTREHVETSPVVGELIRWLEG